MKTVNKTKAVIPKEPKETQGHQKMLQLLEDLKRNKHFLKDLRRYEKAQRIPEDIKYCSGLDLLIAESLKLNDAAEKFSKKYWRSADEMSAMMADAYGLDLDLVSHILCSMDKRLGFNPYEDYTDMCVWQDNNDKHFAPDYIDLPLAIDPVRRNHLYAYPVSIDIHKFASKRDVLDFIDKNWERIYESLGVYTDYKPVRFRKRKLNQEIVDFIWTNKAKKGKEIKELLDEKFPQNELVYYEIPKIISVERARRLG